jgi:hypothetical protein
MMVDSQASINPCRNRVPVHHEEALFDLWKPVNVYQSLVRLTCTKRRKPRQLAESTELGWVYTPGQAVQNGDSGRSQTLKEKVCFT